METVYQLPPVLETVLDILMPPLVLNVFRPQPLLITYPIMVLLVLNHLFKIVSNGLPQVINVYSVLQDTLLLLINLPVLKLITESQDVKSKLLKLFVLNALTVGLLTH